VTLVGGTDFQLLESNLAESIIHPTAEKSGSKDESANPPNPPKSAITSVEDRR